MEQPKGSTGRRPWPQSFSRVHETASTIRLLAICGLNWQGKIVRGFVGKFELTHYAAAGFGNPADRDRTDHKADPKLARVARCPGSADGSSWFHLEARGHGFLPDGFQQIDVCRHEPPKRDRRAGRCIR